MSCTQQQCQTAHEERIAGVAKSNHKGCYNSARSKLALRIALGGVKNHKVVRSTSSKGKASRQLEIFRAVCRRDQGKHGQTPRLVTHIVEMKEGAFMEREVRISPKNGCIESSRF